MEQPDTETTIESLEQDVEFILVDVAIAVEIAQFENLARFSNNVFVQCGHDCYSVYEPNL